MFGFLRAKSSALEEFEKRTFKFWEVANPSNAQRLRLRLSIISSASAIISSKTNNAGKSLIDKVYDEVIQKSGGLDVKISEIFNFNLPKHTISFSQADFISVISPPGVRLTGDTKVDGKTAIAGLCETFGQQAASWISSKAQGPFGSNGAAATLMYDLAVGGEAKGLIFVTVSKDFMETIIAMTK